MASEVPAPYSGTPPASVSDALRISDTENVLLRAYGVGLKHANDACVASALVAAEGR